MIRIFGLLTPPPANNPEPAGRHASMDDGAKAAPASVPVPVEPAPVADSLDIAVGSGPAQPTRVRQPKERSSGPRLFAQSDYIAAVRACDGTILSHGVAAAPSDVLEFFGAGFGRAAAGNAADTDACVATVSIGGMPAEVHFAGRVGPGLYEFHVVVPAGLANGDHAVVASVNGVATESPALLKVAKTADAARNGDGRYAGFLRNAALAAVAEAEDECSLAWGA